MERFLADSAILSAVRRLLHSSKRADMAVAFWGKGAPKRLGLTRDSVRTKRIRLICNLNLGGTNPEVIEQLRSWLGKKEKSKRSALQQLDWLHAKVYLFDKAAIVGSANASASGLTLEGKEAAGLREVALMTTEQHTLRRIQEWFDQTWLNSRPIKDEDLSWAQARWTTRRRAAARPSRTNAERAEYFKGKNLNVSWFGDHMTQEQEKTGDQLKPQAFRALESPHKDFLVVTEAERKARWFKRKHVYLMFHCKGKRVTDEGVVYFPFMSTVRDKEGSVYAYCLSYKKASDALKDLADQPGLQESFSSPVIEAIKQYVRRQVEKGKSDGAVPLSAALKALQ